MRVKVLHVNSGGVGSLLANEKEANNWLLVDLCVKKGLRIRRGKVPVWRSKEKLKNSELKFFYGRFAPSQVLGELFMCWDKLNLLFERYKSRKLSGESHEELYFSCDPLADLFWESGVLEKTSSVFIASLLPNPLLLPEENCNLRELTISGTMHSA